MGVAPTRHTHLITQNTDSDTLHTENTNEIVPVHGVGLRLGVVVVVMCE